MNWYLTKTTQGNNLKKKSILTNSHQILVFFAKTTKTTMVTNSNKFWMQITFSGAMLGHIYVIIRVIDSLTNIHITIFKKNVIFFSKFNVINLSFDNWNHLFLTQFCRSPMQNLNFRVVGHHPYDVWWVEMKKISFALLNGQNSLTRTRMFEFWKTHC